MQFKNLLLLLLLLTLSLHDASSQDFNSSFEEEVFSKFKADSLNYDYIQSLSVINEKITQQEIDQFKERLQQVILSLPQKETKNSREKKRVKKVYDAIHKEFFKKYEDFAYFPQIFKSGIYNCVTATALYAYVFNEIGIPFHVKDLPTHVFLIAYPETLNIQLETTAPGSYGFLAPKQSEINKIVASLEELKLVTQEEINNKGINDVYMDYFFGENHIDKVALIGMQYYNQAIQSIQEEDFKSALNRIEKSLVFYDYPYSKFLKKQLLIQNLTETNFNSKENITILFDAFENFSTQDNFNLSDLDYYLHKIVINDDNNLTFIEEVLDYIPNYDNSEVTIHIKKYLLDYAASRYATDLELEGAIRTAGKLLSLHSENKRAKEILTYSLGKTVFKLTISEKSLEEINSYITTYPFIKDNIEINTKKTIILANLAINSFRAKEEEKAEAFIVKFEEIFDEKGDKLLINPEAISTLYLKAGRYYYGKVRYKEALRHFEKGLSLNPDNFDLKKMTKWAKEDLNK